MAEATEKSKIGELIMENRSFSWGDGGFRGCVLKRVVCKEVLALSIQDLQGSRVICILIALLSFRVQIASESLELLVQHDKLRIAKSYGCLWLDHILLRARFSRYSSE